MTTSITAFETLVATADLPTLRTIQTRVKGRSRLSAIVAERLGEIPGTPEARARAFEARVAQISDLNELRRLEAASRNPTEKAIVIARLCEIPGSPHANATDADVRRVVERNRAIFAGKSR